MSRLLTAFATIVLFACGGGGGGGETDTSVADRATEDTGGEAPTDTAEEDGPGPDCTTGPATDPAAPHFTNATSAAGLTGLTSGFGRVMVVIRDASMPESVVWALNCSSSLPAFSLFFFRLLVNWMPATGSTLASSMMYWEILG